MITCITKSKKETIKLGEKIARSLKSGDVIALIGELGSGKTTFVKGLAKGLGVKDYRYVNSPTFVIIKEYISKIPLYHFDIYRLGSSRDIASLGCEEYFYGNGICAIEWADKIKELLPKRYLEVKIEILENGQRKINIEKRRNS